MADRHMVGMKSRCAAPDCKTWAYFNLPGEQRGFFCSSHKEPGMVDVVNKLCGHPGCNKHPNFNHPGMQHAIACSQHKEPGMVNVNIRDRQCLLPECSKYPSCNYPGQADGLYCGKHKAEGMVNVTSRHCAYEGCIKQPNFNHDGSQRGLYCCAHKEPGMINVVSKPCAHPGCQKQPSFNFPGQTQVTPVTLEVLLVAWLCMRSCLSGLTRERGYSIQVCVAERMVMGMQGLYCSPHKQPGMINVKQKHCAFERCTNRPSFNFPGANFLSYDSVCYKERQTLPCHVHNRSWEGSIIHFNATG